MSNANFQITLINSSIVVAQRGLHPTFLKPNLFSVVLREKEPSNMVITPVFGLMQYEALRLQITLDENRFEVSDHTGDAVEKSLVYSIAECFLKAVPPHAALAGIGFNFISKIEFANPAMANIKRLYSDALLNHLNTMNCELQAIGAKLIFMYEKHLCTLSLEPHIQNKNWLIANINVHTNVSNSNEALQVLPDFVNAYTLYQKTLEGILTT